MIKLQAKIIELNFLLKFSDLKSNFTLTLDYLNPALNNLGQVTPLSVHCDLLSGPWFVAKRLSISAKRLRLEVKRTGLCSIFALCSCDKYTKPKIFRVWWHNQLDHWLRMWVGKWGGEARRGARLLSPLFFCFCFCFSFACVLSSMFEK